MKTYLSTIILSLAAAALLAMGGCATGDYAVYAKAQGEAETARHAAEAEKYKALAGIAATGSDSARVAAVMALALGNGGGQGAAPGGPALRAPEASNPLLQWAGVLVPGLVQAYSINANMRLGLTQSDNSASVARSTNDTFTGIAKLIQAPGDITNTDRHDVLTTPAPVVITPVIPAPVVTPVVQIVPVVPK